MSAHFPVRFLSVVGLVLAVFHVYLWRRAVVDTGLRGRARVIGTGLIIALYLFLPLSGLLARQISFRCSYTLSWLTYLWLGMLTLFCFFFLFADCLKILLGLFRCLLPDLAQRQLQARRLAGFAAAMVFLLSAFGVRQCLAPPAVKKFSISLTGLPSAFSGFTIAQISDIHLGRMMRAAELAKIVRQVNELQPDLVAITGDLVDCTAERLRGELAPLAQLKAKQGIFFVTGNHEYYSGIDDWLPEIRKMGATVLDNRWIAIRRGSDALIIAGVNDHKAGRFGRQHAPDFAKALDGIRQHSHSSGPSADCSPTGG